MHSLPKTPGTLAMAATVAALAVAVLPTIRGEIDIIGNCSGEMARYMGFEKAWLTLALALFGIALGVMVARSHALRLRPNQPQSAWMLSGIIAATIILFNPTVLLALFAPVRFVVSSLTPGTPLAIAMLIVFALLGPIAIFVIWVLACRWLLGSDDDDVPVGRLLARIALGAAATFVVLLASQVLVRQKAGNLAPYSSLGGAAFQLSWFTVILFALAATGLLVLIVARFLVPIVTERACSIFGTQQIMVAQGLTCIAAIMLSWQGLAAVSHMMAVQTASWPARSPYASPKAAAMAESDPRMSRIGPWVIRDSEAVGINFSAPYGDGTTRGIMMDVPHTFAPDLLNSKDNVKVRMARAGERVPVRMSASDSPITCVGWKPTATDPLHFEIVNFPSWLKDEDALDILKRVVAAHVRLQK